MKKFILFACLCLTSAVFAEQFQSKHIETVVAQVATTEAGSPVVLTFSSDTSFVAAQITNVGYCLNAKSQLVFGLHNKSQVSLTHINGEYCDIGANFVSRLKASDIKKLSESPLEFIYLTADGDFYKAKSIRDKYFLYDILKGGHPRN